MKLTRVGSVVSGWLFAATAIGLLAGCGSGDGGNPSPVSTTGSTTGMITTGGLTGGGPSTGSTTSIATTGSLSTTGSFNGRSTDGSGSAGGSTTSIATTGGSIIAEAFGTSGDVTGSVLPPPNLSASAVSSSVPIQVAAGIFLPSYPRAVPMHGEMSFGNVGSSPVQFDSQAGDPSLDVGYQVSGGGKVYFSTSISRQSHSSGGSSTLNAGASEPLEFWWNQRDQQGNFLPPGQYTIQVWWAPAIINGTPLSPAQVQAQFSTPPISFTIQDGSLPDFIPPPPITDLAAAVQANGSVRLSWTAVPGSYGYYIYRRPIGGTYTDDELTIWPADQPPIYTIYPPAGTYSYIIKATYGYPMFEVTTFSLPSNEVSVTGSPQPQQGNSNLPPALPPLNRNLKQSLISAACRIP